MGLYRRLRALASAVKGIQLPGLRHWAMEPLEARQMADGPVAYMGGWEVALYGARAFGDSPYISSGTSGYSFGLNGNTRTLDITGNVTLGRDAGAFDPNLAVTVHNGASLTLGSTQHFGQLNILNGGTATMTANGTSVLSTRGLSIGGTGTLDITNNSFVVDYTGLSAFSDISGWINSAYGSGSWSGHGITSSWARDSGGMNDIGVAESGDLGLATFQGQAVDSTAVVGTYTSNGDANLDGYTDDTDQSILDQFFGTSDGLWDHGDFNRDGFIDDNDSSLLGGAYNPGHAVRPPVTVDGDGTATVGSSYALTLNYGSSDFGGNWIVDWGDGTTGDNTSTGAGNGSDPGLASQTVMHHTYTNAGAYTIQVQLTNGDSWQLPSGQWGTWYKEVEAQFPEVSGSGGVTSPTAAATVHGDGSVRLSWGAVSGATQYLVQATTDAPGATGRTFHTLGTTTDDSFTTAPLHEGSDVWFRVLSSDGSYQSQPGTEAQAHIPSVTLTASAPSGAGAIDLAYTSSAGESLQLEEAAPGDFNYHTITGFVPDYSPGVHTFHLSGLTADAHYGFRLKAVNDGIAEYANAFDDTNAGSVPLTAPASIEQGDSNGSGLPALKFTWDPGTDPNASSGFTVNIRGYADGEPLALFNASPTAQSITIGAGDFTADNQYVVYPSLGAHDDQVEVSISDGTDSSAWAPLQVDGATSAPTSASKTLTVSAGSGTVIFSLGTASSDSIYGLTTGNTAVLLGSMGGGASLTLNTSSIPGNVSQAIAFDGNDYSNPVVLPGSSVFTPPMPINLVVTAAVGTAGQPLSRLVWDNNASNETGYIVQREDLSDFAPAWGTVATLAADQTSYTDTPASATDVYDYRVIATNAVGNSLSSNVVLTWFAPLVSGVAVNPSAPIQGRPISFSVSAAPTANNADTLNYAWTLTDPTDPTHPTTLTTSVPMLSFTPPSAGSWSVALAITDTNLSLSTTLAAKTFNVTAAPPLQILGPTFVTDGQPAEFTALGATTGLSWTVTHGGNTVVTSSDATLRFAPSDSGTYTIQATGSDSSGSHTSSVTLSVAHLAPAVTISGSTEGYTGRAMVFGSHVEQTPGVSDTLSYAWTLLDASGAPHQYPAGGAPTYPTDLSTFVVPGSLPAGSYQVQLVVTDLHDGASVTAKQTFAFSVLAATTPAGLTWGDVPLAEDAQETGIETDTVVQQPDGKLVVMSHGTNTQAWTGSFFMARLNPDLTLDTTFGPNQNGVVASNYPIDPSDSEPFTHIYAGTYDPVNKDIIAVGEVQRSFDSTLPVLVVAAYLTQPTVAADGHMALAGELDPSFNFGQPKYIAPTGTITGGLTAVALADGTVLVGGGIAAEKLDFEDGAFADNPDGVVADFFLAKLTTDGQLDTTFGTAGIAEQPGLSGVPSMPFVHDGSRVVLHEGIEKLIVLSDGQILAGGHINRPVYDSGGALQGFDTGFALVRYNSDGTIDTSFGSGGQTFTSSQVFTGNGTAVGVAALTTMKLLADGRILTAGMASSGRVVLAQYTTSGALDTSYGSGGIMLGDLYDTNFIEGQFPVGWSVGADGIEMLPGFQSDAAAVAFLSDGNLYVSSYSTGAEPWGYGGSSIWYAPWQLVRIDTSDGSIDTSFAQSGELTISSPSVANSAWFGKGNAAPGSLLMTDQGLLSVGTAIAQGDGSGGFPVVARYNSGPAPAADRLRAAATSAGSVTLSWSNTGYGEEGFEIRRATSAAGLGASTSAIGFVGPDQTDFVDSAVAADTDYYYQIVPFYSDASGVPQVGTASGASAVHTLPGPVGGRVLKESLLIPTDGTAVTSGTVLQTGTTYLIVASGTVHLSDDYTADAGYWYSIDNPRAFGPTFDAVDYGVGINVATGSPGPNVVPAWGPADPLRHLYTTAVVGQGDALTFQFHQSADTLARNYLADGEQPLEVQIYAVASSGSPSLSEVTPGGRTLEETVHVPEDGSSAVTSSTVLQANTNYVLVATGSFASGGYMADAADSWYTQADLSWTVDDGDSHWPNVPTPPAFANTYSYPSGAAGKVGRYGIAFRDGSTAPDASEVPYWGSPDFADHTYTYAVVGQGTPLTFKYVVPPNVSGTANFDVAIYQVDEPSVTSSTAAAAVMRIAKIGTAVGGAGTAPVINGNTPISIIAADPDGTAVPWVLSLVSPSGQRTVLASGQQSVGSLPDGPAAVALLNPALYENGVYTLELSSSDSDPAGTAVDRWPVAIETTVKTGGLTLPSTDGVLNTAIGPITISRTYDSSWTDQGGGSDSTFQPIAVKFHDGSPTTLEPDHIIVPQTAVSASDFGNGWSFDPFDARMVSTAQPDTFDPTDPRPVLRAGDLISFTLPGGETHIFEFAPAPLGNSANYANHMSGTEYAVRFVAIDGSGATLSLPYLQTATLPLTYDAPSGEYVMEIPPPYTNDKRRIAFSPERLPHDDNFLTGVYDDEYRLTTQDGRSYIINSGTGRIRVATDTNGNTVKYNTAADGSVTATSQNGQTVFTTSVDGTGRIVSVGVPGQNPITYTYDATGNLVGVQSLTGDKTRYFYQDTNHPHALTAVINAQGNTVVQAQYDPATGRLQSLINAQGTVVSAAMTVVGPTEVSQTIVDAVGDVTQNVFDERTGNLARKIQLETDSSGNVLDYIVTATNFAYVTDNIANVSDLRTSGVRMLQSVDEETPFEISGSDDAGLRYSLEPAPDTWKKRTVLDTADDPADPAHQQVLSQSKRLTDDGKLQTTTYGNYVVVNQTFQLAKPQVVIQKIQTPDSGSSTGYDDQMQSGTYGGYDGNGNLQYSLNTVVPDPAHPGGYLAEGTYYTYTGGGNVPAGLVSQTQSASGTITPSGTVASLTSHAVTSQNTYYSSNDVLSGVAGAAYGQVKYSIDAAGQETFYAYDAEGHTILNYAYKTWTGADGSAVTGWVGTASVYNSSGALTDTYQVTYLDSAGVVDGSGHHILVTSSSTSPGTPPSGQDGGVSVPIAIIYGSGNYNSLLVSETVYAGPLHTRHIDYDSAGRKIDSVDQYGGVTSYTYDGAGNLIRTVNPDGTETRSVYDALNRRIWTTDGFVPANGDLSSPANTAVATKTVYNQLGQVVETDRYRDVAIEITGTKLGSIAAEQSQAVGGSLLSTSQTYYDPQGNAIETISPSGVRTGAIYYPDGQAKYTGILTNTAPDGGHSTTAGDITTLAFTLNDFASYSQSDPDQYDSTLGLFYNRSIDQLGHHTDTYQDGAGRSVRTVYDDGSFTETLYGVGGQPVTADQEGDSIPIPSSDEGWTGIPSGGQEVVDIGQRKSTDPLVITYRLYDAAQRLTDVWQPAVTDANPDSPTYGESVRPHATYLYDPAGKETAQITADEQGVATEELASDGQTAYQWWLAQDSTYQADYPFTNDTRFAYDQNGREVSQALPGGESDATTYDAFARQSTHTDFKGQVARYVYDDDPSLPTGERLDRGRLVYVNYYTSATATTIGQQSHYTYDTLGRRQTVTDDSGTTTYSYDALGNMTEADTPEGTIHYVYDPAAGNHTETYTDYTDTTYGYDDQGRLTSVTVEELNGTTLTTPLVTTYGYDDAGNNTGETLPNGVSTTYGYDDLNRLTAVATTLVTATLFSQQYVLNDDGTRASVAETQRQPGGTTVTSTTEWTYDALKRLTSETYTSSVSGQGYSDAFAYDLESNRMSKVHTGPGAGVDETIEYTYNGDNELTVQVSSLSGETDFTYDANGSLAAEDDGTHTTVHTYDLRNKMVGVAVDGVTSATYVYDDAENRVAETAGGTTTLYLTDTQNPTGYAQPAESKSSATGAPATTYLLGDRVIGQVDVAGAVSYLIADGHRSTRSTSNSAGAVTATFNYDAFGSARDFDPAVAPTPFLFGGDAMHDPASGLDFHGNGVRPRLGFTFIQRDPPGYSRNQDPITLHTYLYVGANPVSYTDRSGHDALSDEAFGDIYGVVAEDVAGYEVVNDYVTGHFGDVQLATEMDWALGGALLLGTAFDLQGAAIILGTIAGGAAQFLLEGGIETLIAAQESTDWEATQELEELSQEETDLAEECEGGGCFLAGTPVLRGDGRTEEAIDNIQVGQRVATDGGAANSVSGKTVAAEPNATSIDPATWREITIEAGDWEVHALEPLSWIGAHHVATGGTLHLYELVDLPDMGATQGMIGTVMAVDPCPPIEGGPGRVVLTTITHLSDFVFKLTLRDESGRTETLGVSGLHRFYDQTKGWTQAQYLRAGEVLRGAHGSLTVVSSAHEPGTQRVYNMTVEADHVYYVGHLTALVHNNCGSGEEAARQIESLLQKLQNLHQKIWELEQTGERMDELLAELNSTFDELSWYFDNVVVPVATN